MTIHGWEVEKENKICSVTVTSFTLGSYTEQIGGLPSSSRNNPVDRLLSAHCPVRSPVLTRARL
jgi:hypothetical protein